MSAELLRRAASSIREDKAVEETLGHIDGRDFRTWLAVADWVQSAADTPNWDVADLSWLFDDEIKVARAYLGESS